MFAKEKRGQVALFIIIGLILLLSVTIFLIFRNANTVPVTTDDVTLNLEFIEVNEHIQFCLQTSAEDAVVLNGQRGGLYNPAEFVYGNVRSPVTTFFQFGNVIAPSKDQVAYSIGLEFLQLMPPCLDTFNGTTETLTHNADELEVSVSIQEGKIRFTGDYPITSTKPDKSHTFSQFSHTVESVRLFTIIDLATELSYLQQADPGYICVTCILDMADKNFMLIDFTDIGNNQTVYTFVDLFSSINDEQYTFMMSHEH